MSCYICAPSRVSNTWQALNKDNGWVINWKIVPSACNLLIQRYWSHPVLTRTLTHCTALKNLVLRSTSGCISQLLLHNNYTYTSESWLSPDVLGWPLTGCSTSSYGPSQDSGLFCSNIFHSFAQAEDVPTPRGEVLGDGRDTVYTPNLHICLKTLCHAY